TERTDEWCASPLSHGLAAALARSIADGAHGSFGADAVRHRTAAGGWSNQVGRHRVRPGSRGCGRPPPGFGSLLPVLWTLLAVALSVLAAVLRVAHSGLALYIDAAAWVILGLSTGWVVTRAVFGPGRVTYHRIVGAILLYLLIGATFVALYTFIGLLSPGA